MKLSHNIWCLALLLLPENALAFAPSSSFTAFSTSAAVKSGFEKSQNGILSQRSQRGYRKGSEMKMMFDQLSSAISDVAKNIGGRKR
jgi:hypothetical protein